MNVRDLEYSIKLADIKNFSKVAASFNVSQPTITFALQRLEKSFGAGLMIRHRAHGDLSLTDSGQQLLCTRRPSREYQLAQRELTENSRGLAMGLPPIMRTLIFRRLLNG